jgi:hypothetical protein
MAKAKPLQACTTKSASPCTLANRRANLSLATVPRRFQCRLDAHQRQLGVLGTQFMDGCSGGGVAGHHQGFDVVLRQQMRCNRLGPLSDKGFAFFAIRGVGVVGQIHKAFVWQCLLQGPQHTQAPNAAVKNANGGIHIQPALTPMPLNSPVAMRFCHSAGPVMWALVPPASTATVTGMSTTSNS